MAEPEEPITHPKAKALAECCHAAYEAGRNDEREAAAKAVEPFINGRKMADAIRNRT